MPRAYCHRGSNTTSYNAGVATADLKARSDRDARSTKRRRRSPEEARREILDAATTLLQERPAHEVTVIAIMARTTLSRKAFYVYFRDRTELLTSLVAPLRAQADVTLQRWREATDIVGAGREALRSAAILYQRHGVILRALAEASRHDPEAAEAWSQVTAPVVAVAAQKIAEATAAGDSHGLDPEATARALVTMNVHYLLDLLAGNHAADIDTTAATLTTIWERTIYLRQPAQIAPRQRPPG